jgi:hypothetical protein
VASSAVRVKGLRELQSALRKVNRGLNKELRAELKNVGEVVRADATSRFSGIDARSASGYKVRVRQRGVAVEQSLKRVTGRRGDYGALQMRRALLPAMASNEDEVVHRLEGMLDRLGRSAGF